MIFYPYKPPILLNNAHLQTIYPVLFRKIDPGFYQRERIDTDDNDFLDLDWSRTGKSILVIISHGLEGNSHRAYVTGMVKAVNRSGWDALAWNYRSYHNGVTDDLSRVINHSNCFGYKKIFLIGFSLGGNLSLLYLGREKVDPLVTGAVVFSVPCHLQSSADVLARPGNWLYMKRFLRMLHKKIKAKMAILPGRISDEGYENIKTFRDFDNRYTAPIHGFKDAEDYWEKCSSLPAIPDINVPTLIVNAMNDPFLSKACYPIKEADQNSRIYLEMPRSGGHVGFPEFNPENLYWSEKRVVAFINHLL